VREQLVFFLLSTFSPLLSIREANRDNKTPLELFLGAVKTVASQLGITGQEFAAILDLLSSAQRSS